MKRLKPLALSSMLFTLSPMLFGQGVWVETTQKDFADGIFEHNIYCTHRPYIDSLPGNVEFVQRFDYNNDGWMDVIVSNIVRLGAGMVRDFFYVYWNTRADPYFLEDHRTAYPTGGSGEICGADLNADGYPDLIAANYRMYAEDTTDTLRGGVTVFWGTETGFDPRYDSLPGCGTMEAVYVADLNKDGYLDIIAGGSPGSVYVDSLGRWKGMDTIGIWWGQPGGPHGIEYSKDNLTALEGTKPRHNFEVADLDKDGYYDIIAVNYARYDSTVPEPLDTLPHLIFWGNDSGYSQEDTTQLTYCQPQAHGLTVADFDKDGWLDLVFTGLELDTFAFLYYGEGNRKFKEPDTLFPGVCFGGSIAADVDEDGWLDIVFLVGNSELAMVAAPIWVYYGGPNGFSEAARQSLGPKEWKTSGGLLGDFNKDEYLDLWVDDWITLGGNSCVLWGPTWTNITHVPNHTDHHGVSWEIGNTYNRESCEEYISSIYDADTVVNWDKVFAMDSCPQNTYIIMAVRTGDTPTPDNSWSGWYELPERPSKENDWLCGTVPDTLNSRHIQYKATFSYPKYDMAGLPVLYEVRIEYGAVEGVEGCKGSRVYREKLIVKPSTIENRTVIEYTIPEQGEILLGVYDAIGKLVHILDKGHKKPGEYRIIWNIKDEYRQSFPSGAYFIKLKTEGYSKTQKVILFRQ